MKKLVVIMLLLTLSLTACSGKAGATSGQSSTATGSTTVSSSSTAASSTAIGTDPSEPPSEPDVAEPEPPEPIAEPEPTATGTVGTADHPVAVDPAPYWQGEDYFDIESYLYACGGTDYQVKTTEFGVIQDVECTIGNYRVTVLASNYGSSSIVIRNLSSDVSSLPIWTNGVSPEEVRLDNDGLMAFKHTINLLLKIMPRIIAQEDDVFLGSGVSYSINGVKYD